MYFLDLLFFIVKFVYFDVDDNFHVFTLNWFFTTVPNFYFSSLTWRFATPQVG